MTSNTKRQRKFKANQRKRGLVRKEIYVFPHLWGRVKEYVELLVAKNS